MPDDFPRINVSEREDVDHVLEVIKAHALQLVRKELKVVGKDQHSKALSHCEKSIDRWIASARSSLEPNLSINGLLFSEGDTKSEPFDQALSQRVQQLTEQSDNLTAQVIEARKTLPSRRAAALRARYEVIDERQRKAEARRRKVEEEFERQGVQGSGQSKPTLERADEVKTTLEIAVGDIEKLAVALLEQSSAAQEQAKFVKRLRTMSASFA